MKKVTVFIALVFSILGCAILSALTNDKQNKTITFSGVSESGVYVQASADEGVLPAGTTMHLRDVLKNEAEDAASQVLGEDIYSAQGIDISFYNAQGIEIEPSGHVNVSIKLTNSLKGEEFALVHVPDNNKPEYVSKGSATGADFTADEFSLYVLAGVGTENDPISNVYREYTIGFGESISILSDEKNHDGTWIPGVGNPAWNVVDVAGGNVNQLVDVQRERGTADVQPRLVLTAKNKTGTIRAAFKYTHPEDKTHKTATGSFVATHYYLIHIVDKSTNSYSVLFRNNDGTGISHVGENDLKYTTENGVTATRNVNSNFTHTFTISEDPSTRAGKVTLIMPNYPGNTTRTTGGKTYQFVGWSLSASAIPTTTAQIPIVYPNPDAHIFIPGSKFPLDRDITLWAVWAPINNMTAKYFVRIDDHISNEPQSHGNASYVQIGDNITYTLPKAQFKTDPINGIDQGWEPSRREKPWPARIFSDLKAAGKLPDSITNAEEFKARYRVVWSTMKRENDGWHIDGLLYEKELYNLAYHENGDLVVVSSMPEGIKDIQDGETSPIDTKIPNRYDMIFVGWNTEPDGNGTPYIPGTSVVVSKHPELDTSIRTLHLYAQWQKATKYTYTVRYLEAGTNKVLKNDMVYGDQILGNKIYSAAESKKSSSDIGNYVFSYADPDVGSGDGHITIGDDNSKNVITLYYMPTAQDILATALFLHKTDSSGNALEGAKFELINQQDNTSTYFMSDKYGAVQIPFTEDPGDGGRVLAYTLVEYEAPAGYEKSQDVYTIYIRRGQARVMTFPGGISKTIFPLEATVLKNGNNININNITIANNIIPNIPMANVITANTLSLSQAQSLSKSPQTGNNTVSSSTTLVLSSVGVFGGAACLLVGIYIAKRIKKI